MCDCYNLITETQVTHEETNAFSSILFGTPGTPCTTTYNGSEAACALYNCPSARTYTSSVQTILQSAIVAGGGIPACYTFSLPEHTQEPRSKNTEYCFCCVKRQKHEVSKRKDLFFSTKISRVLLSMVVTFCGYPRYLCAQAEACGGVDGGGMTPTICLCRKKGGKLTAMHANSFFYARQVSLFFCLSALWIRL